MSYWSDERRSPRGNRPCPFGLGVKIRPYFVLGLDCGPATAFELGLVWPDFDPQRCPSGSVSRP